MRVEGRLAVALRGSKVKLDERNSPSGQTQILQHLRGRMSFVERIKMQARHASLEKFGALLRGVLDAERRRGLVITFQLMKTLRQCRRNARAAHSGELFDLGRGQNRDDAGADWHRDAKFVSQVIPKFKEVRVVEKKLREHEVGTGIDLLLQMLPIGELAFFAGHVAFGKTSRANGKAAGLPNEPDEFV